MCGIVAIINANPKAGIGNKIPSRGILRQDKLFYDMMLASTVRGTDGTGIFQVDRELKVWTWKDSAPAPQALEDPYMQGMLTDVSGASITVGHVRAATQGEVSRNNCHPFNSWRDDSSMLIGVHNGTLYGWDTPATDFEVDSAWAIETIAQKGNDAFEEFYGAFAFIWYDTKDPGKVRLVRNNERPLHIVRSVDGSSLYVASEAGMLRWLLDKHNISVEDAVYSLDTNTVVEVDTTQATLSLKKVGEFEDYHSYYVPSNSKPSYPTPSVPVTPPATAPSSNSYSWGNSKKSVVDSIKACLQRSRRSLVAPDEGPTELRPTGDPWVPAKASWFVADGADSAEVARAQKEGLYGTVVDFEAVEYDDITNNIVGEIVTPLQLDMPVAYMSEADKGKAENVIDKKVRSVIIGARHFANELEYIVVPLNEQGMKELAA